VRSSGQAEYAVPAIKLNGYAFFYFHFIVAVYDRPAESLGGAAVLPLAADKSRPSNRKRIDDDSGISIADMLGKQQENCNKRG
jgi:hypothetical protein